MALAGLRSNFWRNTLSSSTPIWANRGPVYVQTATPIPAVSGGVPTWTLQDGATGAVSTSLFVHGSETRWEGNIAFADGHVEFSKKPDPSTATFIASVNANSPVTENDNLFVDESNEGSNLLVGARRNAYLRVFSAGLEFGATPTDEELAVSGDFVWVDGDS